MEDDLNQSIWDAYRLPYKVFRLMHGENVHRRLTADNSPVLYCTFRVPEITPFVRSKAEHKTPPAKKDVVLVMDSFDDTERYGMIVWASSEDDAVGIFMFDTKELDTFAYDQLESATGPRKLRWRIVQ